MADPFDFAEPAPPEGPTAFHSERHPVPGAPAPAAPPAPPAAAPPPPAPPIAQPQPPGQPAPFDPYRGTDVDPEAESRRRAGEVNRAQAASLTFKGRRERQREHPLLDPFEVGGREVDHIVVRRITTAEMNDFRDELAQLPEGAEIYWPVFFLPWGERLPRDVWEGMDPDDTQELLNMGVNFLPSRFRVTTSGGPQSTATGTATPSTSNSTGSSSG